MNISELPPEMMEKMSAYLTFRERLQVSRTCKLWHELIFCPQFCKRLFLYLRSSKDLEKPYAREMLARCRNIMIMSSIYEDFQLRLLKDYMKGASLKLLKIWASNRTAKRLLEMILEVVPELKNLHLVLLGSLDQCTDEIIRITHQKLKRAVLTGHGNYAIECSKLTVLETDQVNEEMFQSLGCLQGQLQVLQLNGHRHSPRSASYNVLSHYHWDHLRELELDGSTTDDLEESLKQMPCLQKLSLRGSQQIFTGKEVGTATRLSELKLSGYCVDTDSFNRFLTRSSLKRISLLDCTCCSVEVPLKSDSIRDLILDPMFQKRLPLFPSLEKLYLKGRDDTDFHHTLLQIREYYPKLERLTLYVGPGQIGTMRPTPDSTNVTATNSFSLLNKLDKLKDLHLNRIDLTGIDWTICEGSNVNYIHLKGCSIDGTGAEKIVRTFKHLRTFYFDYCYLRQPRANLFDIDKSSTDGLHWLARYCKISYHDIHIEELLELRIPNILFL
ncbi:hypothetical protein RP20_CCG005711 [Aedes albopictus]|nr:hypothetical protein RP20_CCG005711 [Aedes albopictus]